MRSLSLQATGSDTDRLTLGVSNLQVSLMDAETAEKERYSYGFWNLLQAPIDFLFQTLRPYTPNLVSLFVFLALIPLLAFLSLSAGLIVWQNVAVGWQIPLYLQYGDNLQPYAHAILPDLSVRQPYDVVLQLAVPSSESNFALGNFMSALTLSTNNNKTLATVRRPALVIPPKSTFFSSKPHLITIDIPMLDSFVTGTSQVVADVMIGRQDVWKNIGNGEGRELSVFSASLKGILVHKGFRGLVTRFPTFFSMVCSAIFFAILFSILAGCLLPSILQSSPENDAKANPDQLDDNDQKSHLINDQYPEEPSDTATNASEPQEEKDDDNLSQSVKSARRRRRRSTKNKNASEGSSIKSESEPVMIRSDSERSTNPLRRRHSKTLEVDT